MTPNLFHRALSKISDKTRKRVREWCDKIDEMEIDITDPIYGYESGYDGGLYWTDIIKPTVVLNRGQEAALEADGWEYNEDDEVWEKLIDNNSGYYRG